MDRWPDVVQYHRTLLADRVRTDSYQRAILTTVRPGDVVLDVGTGTGVLACLAARAGARRVYAVEAGDVIDVARQVARRNGLDDHVVFLNARAERLDLPERVDVVVTETMGNFGVDEGILGVGLDVRTRLLRDGGRMIPRIVELFAVPVELPDVYAREIECWDDEVWGLDFSPVRGIAANAVRIVTLTPAAFLAEPTAFARAPLLEIGTSEVHGSAAWRAQRAGTLHGFGGWFVAELTAGVRLSNGPPLMTPSWAHAFLPLERPVDLEAGDRVSVSISALANGTVWNWRVSVGDRACGEHSTLWGVPLLRQRLRQISSGHAPTLTREGQAELDILRLVDGRTTLRALAEELQRRHPDFFRSGDDASGFVRDVIARCAR
jgi:protein arginine N-methyltransferase 1